MKRRLVLLVALGAVGCRAGSEGRDHLDAGAQYARPRLEAVGPRQVSNATATPLALYGEGFRGTLELQLGTPVDRRVPVSVIDDRHAYALLPADVPFDDWRAEILVALTLVVDGVPARSGPALELRYMNDLQFPELMSFAVDSAEHTAWITSDHDDLVYRVDLETGVVEACPVGDGPSAVALWRDGTHRKWAVVAHRHARRLTLLPYERGQPPRVIPAPHFVSNILVDDTAAVAYLADTARDVIVAVALQDGFTGSDGGTTEGTSAPMVLWQTAVAHNPRAMNLLDGTLAVGSLQTGELQLVRVRDVGNSAKAAGGRAAAGALGAPPVVATTQPTTATNIVGGTTQDYREYIMGGKAVRALVSSAKLGVYFVSNIGPNIGPNPARMEVSMNPGVSVVDAATGRWVRHLGLGEGLGEGLALDEQRGVLFQADVGLGVVRVFDARALVASDAAASKALRQTLELPLPDGFPILGSQERYVRGKTASVSMHAGPRALALDSRNQVLYALNRSTASIAVIDVRGALQGKAKVRKLVPILSPARMTAQQSRRMGQILYAADFARSAVTCEACHLDGHSEGIFFEKTSPLRIYRSPTVRGARDTPPYFTPASTRSIGETIQTVGNRNRFHRADLTPEEVDALTVYTAGISTLPNPNLSVDGTPPETLVLPDGEVGRPERGRMLFEGRAQCSGCHPAPLFTTDQAPATRGKYLDVGTPHLLPLRPQMQDATFEGFAPPSLMGVWDVFPMLTTASAGLGVTDGGAVVVADPFALKAAVVGYAPKHGRADLLTAQEISDLLAYVLTL